MKAAAGQNKGNQEGISATQRAERDAQRLQEKQAANAAKKAALAATGADGAAAVAAMEAKKAEQRAAKKERAYESSQVAKSNAHNAAGIVREMPIAGGGAASGGPKADKPKLTPEEKRKKAAAAAAAAAAATAGGAAVKKIKEEKKQQQAEEVVATPANVAAPAEADEAPALTEASADATMGEAEVEIVPVVEETEEQSDSWYLRSARPQTLPACPSHV